MFTQHHTMDYLKYLGGNIIATGSAVAQTTTFTGSDFRTWTSWSVAILVGILTAAKLIRDMRKKD